MKTNNGLLKLYVRTLAAWVAEGCPEPNPHGFAVCHAICSNFFAFIGQSREAYTKYPYGYQVASAALGAIFLANYPNSSYPFGGYDAFVEDRAARGFYANPERLEFIRLFNEANPE